MTTGLYIHPYKRGFDCWAHCEGYLSLGVLLWKWEFWANVHGIGPGIDYVRKHFDLLISRAKRQATEERKARKIVTSRLNLMETIMAYETRDDEC